ncbi:hypothetical protein ACSSZE_10460 [Acidithiobacillus caldus]
MSPKNRDKAEKKKACKKSWLGWMTSIMGDAMGTCRPSRTSFGVGGGFWQWGSGRLERPTMLYLSEMITIKTIGNELTGAGARKVAILWHDKCFGMGDPGMVPWGGI